MSAVALIEVTRGFWLGCGFAPTGREHGGENVVRMDI